jgi:hypothetical protein
MAEGYYLIDFSGLSRQLLSPNRHLSGRKQSGTENQDHEPHSSNLFVPLAVLD